MLVRGGQGVDQITWRHRSIGAGSNLPHSLPGTGYDRLSVGQRRTGAGSYGKPL